ncbi:MAG: DUF1232 domain-containing protein [Chloroflexota bacterium]|nr:DUF1232 domain-containing protein [Chloroflexota bacterium]
MGPRRFSAPVGGADALRPGVWGDLRLAWRLFRDPRVAPKLKLAVPALAALYVVSPVDLLPDLLLGLGQVDDLGVLGLAVAFVTRVVPRLAPREVLDEHLAAMGRRAPGDPAAAGDGEGPIEADYTIRQ